MRRVIATAALVCLFPSLAHAHFLWCAIVQSKDASKLHVYFGEAADAAPQELVDRIKAAKAWSVSGRGEPQKIALSAGKGRLEGQLSGRAAANPIVISHTYGVIERGGQTFLLKYYGKTYPHTLPGTWSEIDDEKRLPLEILAERVGLDSLLTVTWNGKPVANSQVVIRDPKGETVEKVSAEDGTVRIRLDQTGTYAVRARMIEETSGTHDETEYASVRHYSTLLLPNAPSQLACSEHALPELPQGVTSFGGAVLGDTAYIYGGNYGSAHSYSNEGQSNDLWALSLKGGATEWERLSRGPKLQGLAMVAHRNALYRVGGFTAMNHEDDDEQDLQSQVSVARFDTSTKTWTDLPSLPEPRSSHDAAVLNGSLYVAGGWNMPGKGKDTEWHGTAHRLDLANPAAGWRSIAPPPFRRRAIALAAFKNRLYVIGGMRQRGGPSVRVDVYDPKSNKWSIGPSLLGTSMDGFGSSAFACAGRLYVSTISGSVQSLQTNSTEWSFVAQMDNRRFFHRLLPWKDSQLIAIGGGNMSVGKVTELDVLKVK